MGGGVERGVRGVKKKVGEGRGKIVHLPHFLLIFCYVQVKCKNVTNIIMHVQTMKPHLSQSESC